MKKSLVAAMFAVMMISLVGCGKAPEPRTVEATEVVEESETIEEVTETTEVEEVTEVPVEETTEAPVAEAPSSPYSYTELTQTMYAQSTVNVRDLPEQTDEKLGSLSTNQEVTVTGQCNETGWYRISYNGGEGFVSDSYLGTEKVAVKSSSQNTSQKASTSSSQSTSEATQAPAQAESQPEKQSGEVDTSDAVWKDGPIESGETLYPDTMVCPSCDFSTTDKEEYLTHLRAEGYQV